MNNSQPFKVADYLHTPEEIAEYINVALEENDEQLLVIAIQDVVEALSKQDNYDKTFLSTLNNNALSTLITLLKMLNLKISVHPN